MFPNLLPFTPLTRFNSRWALAFLSPYLHTGTMSLYSPWVTWPFFHLLHAFFLCFEFCWEFLVHPCRSPTASAWLPTHWDGLFSSMEEVILEKPIISSGPSRLSRITYPSDSSKQIPKQTKFCSLGQLFDFRNY